MITACVIVIIAWGALAFGAVYSWAYTPLLAACALTGAAGLFRARAIPMAGSSLAVLIALLAVMTAGLAQLVPLPPAVLRTISPATYAFLKNYSLSYAVSPSPHALSIDPPQTLLGLAFVGAFILFLAGTVRAFSRTGVRRVVAAILVFGGILALIGIVQKAVLGDHTYMGMKIYGFWTPESTLVTPFGPFVNRNHFAGWMLMGIPLAIGLLCAMFEEGAHLVRPGWRNRLLWLSSPEGGRLVLAGFASVLMALSLAMSMSRSGMAAFALIAMFIGWRLVMALPSTRARATAAALFLVLLVLPALWVGAGSAMDRFSGDPRGSMETRLRVWRDSRAIIRDFPIAGTGLNTFATAEVLYQGGSRATHFEEAHNDYLQLAAEGGILLVLPAAIAVALFVRGVRRRFAEDGDERTTYWIRFGAVSGIIAIALQSLVEFSLQMPGNAAFFVVLLAIALHRSPDGSSDRRSVRLQADRRGSG